MIRLSINRVHPEKIIPYGGLGSSPCPMLSLNGYYLVTNKVGETWSDCQDALYVDRDAQVIAISDGAGASFCPRPWADQLTKLYVGLKHDSPHALSQWLEEAAKSWRLTVAESVRATNASIFTKNRFHSNEPACATFLAVSYKRSDPDLVSVAAIAIGDSCLFHFSNGKLLKAFPIESSKQFGFHPKTICSNHVGKEIEFDREQFEIHEGDQLLFATDAFSKFLLKLVEDESDILKDFLLLQEKEKIERFISGHRLNTLPSLENDDVALVALTCDRKPGVIHDFSFPTQEHAPVTTPAALKEPPPIARLPDPTGKKDSEKPTDTQKETVKPERSPPTYHLPYAVWGLLLYSILITVLLAVQTSRLEKEKGGRTRKAMHQDQGRQLESRDFENPKVIEPWNPPVVTFDLQNSPRTEPYQIKASSH